MPSCWPARLQPTRKKAGTARAYQAYELTRNRLTVPMLRDSAEIAAMRWDDARIRELLVELNLAMNAELETIGSFVQLTPGHASPGSRRLPIGSGA